MLLYSKKQYDISKRILATFDMYVVHHPAQLKKLFLFSALTKRECNELAVEKN